MRSKQQKVLIFSLSPPVSSDDEDEDMPSSENLPPSAFQKSTPSRQKVEKRGQGETSNKLYQCYSQTAKSIKNEDIDMTEPDTDYLETVHSASVAASAEHITPSEISDTNSLSRKRNDRYTSGVNVHKDKFIPSGAVPVEDNIKCDTCLKEKPKDQFVHAIRPDVTVNDCKKCRKLTSKQFHRVKKAARDAEAESQTKGFGSEGGTSDCLPL